MDKDNVIKVIKTTNIDFNKNSICLDGVSVDKEIRENIISQNVSHIAKIEEVRNILVRLQQNMAKNKSVVMDGRDIGTVVLPNAKYKFFLTATVEERATRRYKELINKGVKDISLNDIISDIIKRDNIDTNRDVGPLKQAKDACLLDTTDKTIQECVDFIVSIVLGG